METRASAPSRDRRTTGQYGEDLAHGHLHRLGWQVLERNWRCAQGEVDIIAREPGPGNAGTLVFVEVKTRRGLAFGSPLEAITRDKLCRLQRLAGIWLAEHDERAVGVRIDVIGVLCEGGRSTITHVRGVTR